jgi:hypothetical protein
LRPAASGPNSLPADTAVFTGRSPEIARLLRSGPGVQAIAGMPGVGKTALAVHVAHRLRDAFPDGQIFVNLHGHTAGREPAEVLATLLIGDGLDPRRLPSGVEARAALWRSRMAGRRVLVVLDNAYGSAHVIPLLPASEGALVLVTSRRFLGDLPADAVPIALDVLAADEAGAMFRRLAPAPAEDPAELVAACGHLSLAVALMARLLRRHPNGQSPTCCAPDERYGEEVMAWVILRAGAEPLTAETLRDFCTGRLAGYKIPRYVKVVDAFPLTVTGKVRKVEMRNKSIKELGREAAAAVVTA